MYYVQRQRIGWGHRDSIGENADCLVCGSPWFDSWFDSWHNTHSSEQQYFSEIFYLVRAQSGALRTALCIPLPQKMHNWTMYFKQHWASP